jgi:hypothetical protein
LISMERIACQARIRQEASLGSCAAIGCRDMVCGEWPRRTTGAVPGGSCGVFKQPVPSCHTSAHFHTQSVFVDPGDCIGRDEWFRGRNWPECAVRETQSRQMQCISR